jgi:hypothetical protein
VLTFVLDPGAPSGATLDPVTGVFRWTPAEAQGPGEHVFTVRVRDDGIPSLASTETFTIRVLEVNRPPEPVLIPGPTIHAGGAIRVSIQATDPDVPANTLSFLLLEAPPGARLDPVSGEFNWTSSLTDEGRVYPVQVRVTDNGVPAQSGTIGFGVTVTEPRPVVSVARFEEGITLSWYGIAGHRYLVQTKDRLDATWQDRGGDSLGFGDVITIADTPVNDRTERYYRVMELP